MADGSFTLWAFGDAHVATDLRHGRESLAESMRMSERGGDSGGPAFEWDIALDVGDVGLVLDRIPVEHLETDPEHVALGSIADHLVRTDRVRR